MNTQFKYYSVLIFLIILGVFLGLLMLTSSCNVSKAKKTLSVDSTHVNKVDSGSVKKSTATDKTTADWERQVLIFKDTTINHYSTSQSPVDYNRLAAVINEKGNYQRDRQSTGYDSSWKQQIDSLKTVIKESQKDKTEKSFSFWQIIGIAAGISLVFFIIGKFKISLK